MKTLLRLVLALSVGLAALASVAGEAQWLTDLTKAKAKAEAENKRILVNFTGSDWCGYCIKLHKEVFSTQEFADYAAKNLVLVEVDFPRRKELPAAQKAANEKLRDEHKVEGYPTLVVMNAQGKVLGREVGYGGGGPKAFIEKIGKFKS